MRTASDYSLKNNNSFQSRTNLPNHWLLLSGGKVLAVTAGHYEITQPNPFYCSSPIPALALHTNLPVPETLSALLILILLNQKAVLVFFSSRVIDPSQTM
jgi:hypothetical protein